MTLVAAGLILSVTVPDCASTAIALADPQKKKHLDICYEKHVDGVEGVEGVEESKGSGRSIHAMLLESKTLRSVLDPVLIYNLLPSKPLVR